jgi:hypothetical protein
MAKQNPIRAVLEEELASSNRMLGRYRLAMDRLPKGALVAKRIKGRVFHYLARRHAGKVRFVYQGRLDAGALEKQKAVQAKRQQYRRLISDLQKQIRFLKKALHERKRPSS